MKIAICDDQKQFAERLKNLITEKDAEVYIFHCGEDLLQSAMNFDIVLLDIEMPGIDGLSVAAELFG